MTLPLGEVMNADPVTVGPTATLAEAAAAMRRRGVSSALVVDGDRVAGILTERDLTRAAAAGVSPAALPVVAWMTPDPVTLAPGDDPAHALERMLAHDVRHLPVLAEGRLAGVVSLRRVMRAASLRRVDPWAPGTARGLENVRVAETRLSHIDGTAGRLVYAGHDAVVLARTRTFEDVWHLLHRGSLPTHDAFAREVAARRESPVSSSLLGALARGGGAPMSLLLAAVGAAGAALRLRSWHERDRAEVAAEALRVTAVVPTLIAALWRLGRGESPVAPDPALGHAANYLRMLHGVRPQAAAVLAVERYLVLTMEHGMNASTFTARVIASTGGDVAAAVAGAAGALSGPLHGGAPSLVLDMLDEIERPERAASWIADAVGHGRRLMGFGHRVYRTEDPRAACLRDTAIAIGGERVALARAVETEALAHLRAAKPGRALYTNVEFWAAVVLEAAGIPRSLFTPTFALARSVGWTAHVLEQVADNRLIRPEAEYVGRPVSPDAPDTAAAKAS